ncbi:hypothetical protein L596_011630 [Steinernema carpocapsae]|uniref:J domain-containing protein n=1 Tax=Steinernema carpocapsae TaxID=34508 RepID=A0A4U5NUX2_STECR|nr:hypothetical protein L596_011630 [Steinernema carpocapsae]
MSTIGFFGRRCFSNSAVLFRVRCTSSHYETLGVKPRATEKEIKSAYYKLASEHHPDKTGAGRTSEQALKFVKINSAYEVLKDSKKRREYDTHFFVVTPSGDDGPNELEWGKYGSLWMVGGFYGNWCWQKTFKSGEKEYTSYEEFEKAEERRKSKESDRKVYPFYCAARALQYALGVWLFKKTYDVTVAFNTKATAFVLFNADVTKRVEEAGSQGAKKQRRGKRRGRRPKSFCIAKTQKFFVTMSQVGRKYSFE